VLYQLSYVGSRPTVAASAMKEALSTGPKLLVTWTFHSRTFGRGLRTRSSDHPGWRRRFRRHPSGRAALAQRQKRLVRTPVAPTCTGL